MAWEYGRVTQLSVWKLGSNSTASWSRTRLLGSSKAIPFVSALTGPPSWAPLLLIYCYTARLPHSSIPATTHRHAIRSRSQVPVQNLPAARQELPELQHTPLHHPQGKGGVPCPCKEHRRSSGRGSVAASAEPARGVAAPVGGVWAVRQEGQECHGAAGGCWPPLSPVHVQLHLTSSVAQLQLRRRPAAAPGGHAASAPLQQLQYRERCVLLIELCCPS